MAPPPNDISPAWGVRVEADAGGAVAYARGLRFEVGKPLEFDEQAERVSALEYVLGAFGADVARCLLAAARRRRLEVDHVEVVVDGALDNALTHLGVVGEEGHPGLTRLTATVYASSLSPEAELRAAWEEALARSPLVATFRAAVALDLALKPVL